MTESLGATDEFDEPCVYAISCAKCDSTYVGSTERGVGRRIRRHGAMLEVGHFNKNLQRCHDEHGGNFFVQVLEFANGIDRKSLHEKERGWSREIGSWNRIGGMNSNEGVGGAIGSDASCAKIDEKTAEAIKELVAEDRLTAKEIAGKFGIGKSIVGGIATLNTWGWLRPDLNPRLSELTGRQSGSKNRNSKKTEALVEEAKLRMLGGEPMHSIGKSLGVTSAHLSRIASGEIWGHVRPDLTGELKRMDFEFRYKAEENPLAIINNDDAARIKHLLAGGVRANEVAKAVGIGYPIVFQIYAGKNWLTVESHLNDKIAAVRKSRKRMRS